MNLKDVWSEVLKRDKEIYADARKIARSKHLFSEGLRAWREENYIRAYKYFSDPENVNPIASYYVGCMQLSGRGALPNCQNAIDALREAAKHIPQAQLTLGAIYKTGIPGISQDKPMAYSFFSIASLDGDAFAEDERNALAIEMSDEEVRTGQRLAEEFDAKYPNRTEWLLRSTVE